MDKVIDGQFQRVEKALSTLINSLATYNPNPALAQALVTADQELTSGLSELSTHQRNHARILSLRATSNALDTHLRDSLALLASTRKELIDTPATTFPAQTNPVSYDELLSYARRIAKFTRPPTFREDDVETPAPGQEQDVKVEVETPGMVEGRMNGSIGGTAASTPSAMPNGVMVNGIGGAPGSGNVGESSTALPENISEWINPVTTLPTFVPWPTEETIRRGALASLQILIDQGVDPAEFDPEKSAELEAERKRVEEEAERKREEELAERRRVEEERRARIQEERRRSMAAGMDESGRADGGAGAAKPEARVFTGLDMLDDDMDEDD